MRTALIIAPIVLLAACNNAGGSNRSEGGKFEKRAVQVAGAFDRVSLSGAQNVVVAVGGAPSVRAEGDAERLDRLEIVNEGGNLHIRTKKDSGWSWGFTHDRPVTVYVTMPSISGAAIAGSGDVRIDRAEGARFAGSIAGSGDLEVAALKVGEASFEIAGSGGIRTAGAADRASFDIAGSGDVDAAGLQSRTAKISIAGSGGVRAKATESADVSVMGSGDVELTGGAKCSIQKKGSGDVRCS